jgi:hypothetical protein
MKIRRLSAGLFALAIVSTPAAAQWVHQENGSAFDTEKTQVALTSRGQYAVGLRCTDATDLSVVFITPEAIDRETVGMINLAAPEILLRVDQNDPVIVGAEGDIPDGKLTLHGDAPTLLAAQLMEARSSVSVAARMLGSIYHETEFNVRGSTASIGKMSDLCGLAGE